jgi:hypothetical protein
LLHNPAFHPNPATYTFFSTVNNLPNVNIARIGLAERPNSLFLCPFGSGQVATHLLAQKYHVDEK